MNPSELPVSPPRAWAEIDTTNLLNNLATARKISGCAIMAVLKADAYGHGLESLARIFEKAEVEFIGVANIGEARRIREAGVLTSVYLLGATWNGEREEIVARNVTPCISTLEEAEAFNKIAHRRGVKHPVHIAIDTGMGRNGFLPSEISGHFKALKALDNLEIEGIATHLSSADEDEEFTNQQIQIFEDTIASLGGSEVFKWRHLSNSGGVLGYRNGSSNLARPGLMLYGISPIPAMQTQVANVMTLKSRVTLVRTVPAGHSISYGRSFITTQITRMALVGIGYGDGYPRHLSGKGAEAIIRGKRHPILGRVTMDQIIVGLPNDSDVAVDDEVELFGSNISVNEVAELADTIPWQVFAGITKRVERVYL